MVENGIFYCLVYERKQERQKTGRKIIPPSPHFFILLIWEENGEEKMLNDIIYTNTLTLFISPTSLTFPLHLWLDYFCLFILITFLAPSQHSNVNYSRFSSLFLSFFFFFFLPCLISTATWLIIFLILLFLVLIIFLINLLFLVDFFCFVWH